MAAVVNILWTQKSNGLHIMSDVQANYVRLRLDLYLVSNQKQCRCGCQCSDGGLDIYVLDMKVTTAGCRSTSFQPADVTRKRIAAPLVLHCLWDNVKVGGQA